MPLWSESGWCQSQSDNEANTLKEDTVCLSYSASKVTDSGFTKLT